MNRRTIVCYGDSNTYGYDPRDMMGLRYPTDSIWTTIIEKKLGEDWLILNKGMNGRPLPEIKYQEKLVLGMTDGLEEKDFLVMMLGTNDILLTASPDAALPIQKMEKFLEFWQQAREQGKAACSLVIVAPPLVSKSLDPAEMYFNENLKMNVGFHVLAEKYGVPLIDASVWGVPLAYDGVHFSEEGHRIFAEHFAEEIGKLF